MGRLPHLRPRQIRCRDWWASSAVFERTRRNSSWIVDRDKVKTFNVPLGDVFATLQIYMGGYYVNDFNRFGRTWQVNVEADASFRVDAETMRQFKVRAADGSMVPLGSIMNVEDTVGPVTITRYNMHPAAAIYGASLPGVSTGDVMAMMEAQAKATLPRSMEFEWTELSYLQAESAKIKEFRDLQQNPFMRVCTGYGAGILRTGGLVRKLVIADVGHPGRADVFIECPGRHRHGGAWTSTSSCRSASLYLRGWHVKTRSSLWNSCAIVSRKASLCAMPPLRLRSFGSGPS